MIYEARRMENGRGRWAAFAPREGYWSIPAHYGKAAAEREARRLNAKTGAPR